jgi:hypothetical protein
VIEVGDVQLYIQFFLQFRKEVEQADGVRAAGYGNNKLFAACYQSVFLNKAEDFLLRQPPETS